MPFIKRDLFVQRLWFLGFDFIADTSRAHLFRRGFDRVLVPKVDDLDFEWARGELHRIDPAAAAKADIATRAA